MQFYNSLTRKKEQFGETKDKPVKLYVCGITPYDTTHLGHASTYLFFDVLVRYLGYRGYKVNYVQNVTDIDDDILREAKRRGVDWKTIGSRWTKKYLEDMQNLNVLPPTHFVKATVSIPTMIRIIEALIKKGFAYEKNGNVYFSIAKDQEYGQLSRLNRDQMLSLAKERGGNSNDPLKNDPLDFLLWQKSHQDEPFWSSPWGQGRPGWHIECSSMIHQYLGEMIDIHGGGADLIFPHHESEIAQSEAYTGKKPFSRFFVHTAMLLRRGQKMSKSLRNLVMLDELLVKYNPNTIRWYILSHHYHQPLEYSEKDLKTAADEVRQVESSLTDGKLDQKAKNEFIEALDDDLNTPMALKILKNYPYRPAFEILGFVVKC